MDLALVRITNVSTPPSEGDSLSVLVEQQREVLRIETERLQRAENQVVGLTTAGVALGALFVTAIAELDPEKGLALQAIVPAGLLFVAIANGLFARALMSWHPRGKPPRWLLGQPARRMFRRLRAAYTALGDAEVAFQDLTENATKTRIEEATLALWRARTEVARYSANFGKRPVVVSAVALYLAIGYLAYIAFFVTVE